MKVLYVTSACLTKNTSANMSHNGYVKGLIDNGSEVDIIMAKSSFGAEDKALPHWKEATYYEFESVTPVERLRARLRGVSHKVAPVPTSISTTAIDAAFAPQRLSLKSRVMSAVKGCVRSAFLAIFSPDPLYPLDAQIFKSVLAFKPKHKYDLVVSNSSPSASHKIVEILTQKHRIEYDRWVQIWEDPWYFDLYGGHDPKILEEEHRLLQAASEVLYVSPLTMMYQKRYFLDCAHKMGFVPLPFFEYESRQERENTSDNLVFGYFGDYYSHTRNIQPFYDAIGQTSYDAYINGDANLNLQSTEHIHVGGRVTLDVLAGIQEKTNVLVHLSNLKGGQIPGKIYHYSATNKKILFILDGTDEEQQQLFEFFSPFNRYHFCRNTKEDILRAIAQMNNNDSINNNRVSDFEPKNVVAKFL